MIPKGTVKLTELRTQLERPVGSKSLIVRCGVGMLRLRNDKICFDLTTPLQVMDEASQPSSFCGAKLIIGSYTLALNMSTLKV